MLYLLLIFTKYYLYATLILLAPYFNNQKFIIKTFYFNLFTLTKLKYKI